MVGWQRYLKSVVRLLGNATRQNHVAEANYCTARTNAYSLLGEFVPLQRRSSGSLKFLPCPYYRYLQELKLSSTRTVLAESSSDANVAPVASPLIPVSTPHASSTEESQTVIAKRSKVQAVRKGIKQSPKKLNLVAALVRGMRVEDALIQLQITVKRAAKTVYQVIQSARANAAHNHGLDPERLLVAEAFVGKGLYKKRISYHSKGRSGIKIRPVSRLTVVVREITPEEETEIARLKVAKFKLTKRERRLVPHKLIETTPIWGRKRKCAAPVA